MTDPVDLLGDVAGVRAADRAALLPAAATAGAQLRSTATRVLELVERVGAFSGFESGHGIRPRAVVILATGRAAVDAHLAISLIGAANPVPVVVVGQLPVWVGALDVVVLLAGDAQSGGPGFAEAAQVARRRGAAVLVRAADGGEMAYAAGSSLLVPAVGVPEVLTAGARLTVMLLIAQICGLLPGRLPSAEADVIADLLDAESLAYAPQVDTFVNPAKSLALHLISGAGVFIGADPVGAALAAHGAWVLGEITGRPGLSLTADDIAQSPAVLTSLAARRDLFADPFDELLADGDAESGPVTVPLRAVLIRGNADRSEEAGPAGWAARAWYSSMTSALPHAVGLEAAELVVPLRDSGLPDSGLRDRRRSEADRWGADYRGTGTGRRAPEINLPPSTGSSLSPFGMAWAASALALLRLDFAAVYVGIIAGQSVPVDAPSGLGPHAGSRDLLRPDTVVMTSREQEDFDRWN